MGVDGIKSAVIGDVEQSARLIAHERNRLAQLTYQRNLLSSAQSDRGHLKWKPDREVLGCAEEAGFSGCGAGGGRSAG
jgi:hypothetical protein